MRAVQRFEAAKVVCGAVRCLKTVSPVGEDAGCSTYVDGVVWVVPCARVSPGAGVASAGIAVGGGTRYAVATTCAGCYSMVLVIDY